MRHYARFFLAIILICHARAERTGDNLARQTSQPDSGLWDTPLLEGKLGRVNSKLELISSAAIQNSLRSVRRQGISAMVAIGLFVNATSKMVGIDSETPNGGSVGCLLRPHESARLEIMRGGRIAVSDWS